MSGAPPAERSCAVLATSARALSRSIYIFSQTIFRASCRVPIPPTLPQIHCCGQVRGVVARERPWLVPVDYGGGDDREVQGESSLSWLNCPHYTSTLFRRMCYGAGPALAPSTALVICEFTHLYLPFALVLRQCRILKAKISL